jgi:hypothetical protein
VAWRPETVLYQSVVPVKNGDARLQVPDFIEPKDSRGIWNQTTKQQWIASGKRSISPG